MIFYWNRNYRLYLELAYEKIHILLTNTNEHDPNMPKRLVIKPSPPRKDYKGLILQELNVLRTGYVATNDRQRAEAYRKIISAIQELPYPIYSAYELTNVANIGYRTVEKVKEIIQKGRSTKAEGFRRDPHISLISKLIAINGIGPVAANKLVKDKNVTSIEDLLERHKQLLTAKQQLGLKNYHDTIIRIPRSEMDQHSEFLSRASQIPIIIAGSYRRDCPDSGDIDVLVCDETNQGPQVYHELVKHLKAIGYLEDDIAYGDTKYNGYCRLPNHIHNRRIDIMYTSKQEFPFALFYFTGSGEFNQELRAQLSKQDLRLNEHELRKLSPDGTWLTVDTHDVQSEEDIFQLLQIPYIPPSNRSLQTLLNSPIPVISNLQTISLSNSNTPPSKPTISPITSKKVFFQPDVVDTTPNFQFDYQTKFQPMLAHKWTTNDDPMGWWMSEKLDGVRAIWDGKHLISRLGNAFPAPQWFLDRLPKPTNPDEEFLLDGELFTSRKNFQETVSIVRNSKLGQEWEKITYMVFDIPTLEQPFEKRMEFLEKLIMTDVETPVDKVAQLVKHRKVANMDHLLQELQNVQKLGGEGLMIRQPGSFYQQTRSTTLLKVKTFYDAEARVVEYTPGRGKHAGRMGALICRMESGKQFRIGTGFSDNIRNNPPPIDSIITYRFQELTKSNIPRFAAYVGPRIDANQPKDYVF